MTTANKPQLAWNYRNLIWFAIVHVLSLFSIFYFTWNNLFLLFIGVFLLAPLSINVGYHRLLCHRSFDAPGWLYRFLATLGAIIGAGPPIHWVAMHRLHHRFSDSARDPHDASRGFWHAHVLHFFRMDEAEEGGNHLGRYAPDLMADPYMVVLNRYWIYTALATLPLLYVFGGVGAVLWGGFLRLTVSWHIMWFVNSASHMWGYRNFDTKDLSSNCWWVAWLSAGEGWHNNHHAFPTSAAHGLKWWEFDFSYWIIRLFVLLGWARNVKLPALTTTYAKPIAVDTGVELT